MEGNSVPPWDYQPDEGGYPEDDESAEDVLQRMKELFEPPPISPETKGRHLNDIYRFLASFKIKDAELADRQEIEFLWQQLDRNPAQVKDFVYMVTDINTNLKLRVYPTMPTMSDLWMYAQDFTDPPFTLRDIWRNKNVIPNLTRLGLDRDYIAELATADLQGRVELSERVRFLGWLTGQRFMAGLPYKVSDYAKEAGIEELNINHIAANAVLELREHHIQLKRKAKKYRLRIPLEVEALPDYTDALEGLQGIWNVSNLILLGEKTQE
jgi:hypothetical protein